MNDEIKRCFQVFELGVTASAQEVKDARNQMVKVWHPDRFPNDPKLQQRGQEKLKGINAAYEILTDYFAEQGENDFKTGGFSSNTNSQPRTETNSSSQPKPPHPKPNRPPPTERPAQTYSQQEPSPKEEDTSDWVEMMCHHCKENVRFPEEMERQTVSCPHCEKELFLWQSEASRNQTNQQMKSFRMYSSEPNESRQSSNSSNKDSQTNVVLAVIGFLCIAFGLIDFAGMFFHYDLTGVSWSPIVANVIGWAFVSMASGKK
jgi:hypothetical protein